MSDKVMIRTLPTRAQYALGVRIGQAMVAAVDEGATWTEVIETLEHSRGVAETNRDLDGGE